MYSVGILDGMAKTSGDGWVPFTFRLPAPSLKKYKAAADELEKTLGGQMKVGLSAWLRMAADEKLENDRKKNGGR